jgi:hypothetical protein
MADDLQVLINVKSNADEATRGLDRLQGSIAKNAKAIELLQKDYKVLDRAFNKNNITAQQYARGVQQVDAAIEQLNASNNAIVSSTERVTKSLEKANVAQQKFENTSRKGMRRVELVAQQAGYQIGDLAVQIQGGTNAAVALGQQGSQLLGFFGPAGALAGAGLAIATAFIAPFIKAKEKAEDFYDLLEERAVKLELLKKGIESEEAGQAQEALNAAREELETYRKNAESIGQLTKTQELKLQAQEALVSKLEDELQYYVDLQHAIEVAGNLASDLTAAGDERIDNAQEELDLQNNMINLVRLYYNYVKSEEQKLRDKQEANYNQAEASLSTQISLIRTELALRKNYTDEAYIQERLELEKINQLYEQGKISQDQKELLQQQTSELINQKQQLDDLLKKEAARLKIISLQRDDGRTYSGRGGDPRKQGSDYMQSLEYKTVEEVIEELTGSGKKAAKSLEELNDKIRELEDAADPFREYNRELEDLDKLLKAGKISQKAYNKAVDDLNEGLGDTIPIIGDVEQAFSDWLANGMRDFKGFVSSIKDMFVRLLADLAAQAVRNRILIPITAGFAGGLGNAAAAGTAGGAVAGGGIGATLAAGAYGVGQGLSAALGIGGFTSAGVFNVGANAAVATAAGASPFAATLGAALPVLAAVVFLVGLFTKKTKLLDSGIRTTIKGFDAAIETFKVTQTSRLFGLLKGPKVTSYEDAPAEFADPLIKAIGDMQQSIVDAAGTLGIGAAAFENFSYQFKLSLKGLTEEEQLQKINEEITKMGDSFASLTGHFETMNELLAVAQQRYDLETRLLGLLNDQSALLTRQRELERASVDELNRSTLNQIYALEDAYGAVNSAFATVQRSIEARKTKITNSFNEIIETLQARVQAASDAVGVSRGILSSLEGASGDSGMTRGAGMAYLRSLRGASRITDQKKLDDALQAIADPSQDLYTNFVDYQRDFQDQSNLIRDLEEQAGLQLSTDEKTLQQLKDQEEAARGRYEAQIDKLDDQLEAAQAQLNALFGIDTSVKSVAEAISALGSAIGAARVAQTTAKASITPDPTINSTASKAAAAGLTNLGVYSSKTAKNPPSAAFVERNVGKAYYQIRGAEQLLSAASSLGIQTSGKTGTEIQKAVANATNAVINMDNKTRGQQFAMGGMFGGGVRMVGERGPELEATGPSRIFSTKQTAELFRNPELVAEVKNLREEVAGLRSEQRQLQASNSKYVKRNYDINRKWDTEGLPATRT